MFHHQLFMEIFISLIFFASIFVADPIDAKTRQILRVGQQNLMAVHPQPQQTSDQPTNDDSAISGSSTLEEVKDEPIEHTQTQNTQNTLETSGIKFWFK